MWLRELAWGGVLISPMVMYCAISLVLLLSLRFWLRDTRIGRVAWREGWFDVALFVCLLAAVVWFFSVV